jgi:hypothetical protein
MPGGCRKSVASELMKFISIDAMSALNPNELCKLIEYGREYAYYREINAGGDYYLFAFHYDPFTDDEALLEWRKVDL